MDSVFLVFGTWYHDGEAIERWAIAYQDGKSWFTFDSAEFIHDVKRSVDINKLNELLDKAAWADCAKDAMQQLLAAHNALDRDGLWALERFKYGHFQDEQK